MAMNALVILQARTTSTRLPSKALLPIAGYPSAALAALRAANSGIPVIVATSTDASDDQLCKELVTRNCTVTRGSLEDVLARFADAVKSLPDDAVIVRLTGDNVIPDGGFVTELVEAFEQSKLDYLDSASPQNRLPHGLSGEAFRARSLRKANQAAVEVYDREHVTPWIQRHMSSGVFVSEFVRNLDFSHLRCTIDDREDYERILQIFEGEKNPVSIGWQELLLRLTKLPGEPRFRIPYRLAGDRICGEMTLGTAQLGMKYGIVNRTGKPCEEEAIQIVRRAVAHGVTALDTARAYGESEHVLGRALTGAWNSRAEVITKLDLPATLAASATALEASAAAEACVRRSCEELKTSRLATLLLHSWAHRRAWNGAVWDRLLELRAAGVIGRLGASVYEPGEAQAALEDPDVQHLQIPFSVLDWRWHASNIDKLACSRPEVTIHARSALLQGILGQRLDGWPKLDSFDAAACFGRLEEFSSAFQRESIIDLCFAYVRSQPWISSVVVGCETVEQLDQNLALFCKPKLSQEQCQQLLQAFSEIPPLVLNPAKWRICDERPTK